MTMLSVIVPVYNAEEYLHECLVSAREQSLSDIQIVCVNDGSTDGSGTILAEHAAADPRINVVEQPNQGQAKARNTGIEHAAGRYVLFLDADDYLEPGALETVVGLCETHSAQIAMFRLRYVYMDSGRSTIGTWTLDTRSIPCDTAFGPSEVKGLLYDFVTPGPCNKVLRMDFINQHGLRFHEDLERAEDIPFTYLALAVAERMVATEAALINYRKDVETSLQTTIQEHPLEICRSLRYVKQDLQRAGVFEAVEKDFMNAALHQCLFTLESFTDAQAYRTLYETLHAVFFREIGLANYDAADILSESDSNKLGRILSNEYDTYLFEEVRRAEEVLKGAQRELAEVDEALSCARSTLKKVEGSRRLKLGQSVLAVPRVIRRRLRAIMGRAR